MAFFPKQPRLILSGQQPGIEVYWYLMGYPLRQATEKMSRYMLTDIRVVVGVPDKIVTGEIQIRDQETMLKQFAKIAQVTPVRQSAQLTLLYTASQ